MKIELTVQCACFLVWLLRWTFYNVFMIWVKLAKTCENHFKAVPRSLIGKDKKVWLCSTNLYSFFKIRFFFNLCFFHVKYCIIFNNFIFFWSQNIWNDLRISDGKITLWFTCTQFIFALRYCVILRSHDQKKIAHHNTALTTTTEIQNTFIKCIIIK